MTIARKFFAAMLALTIAAPVLAQAQRSYSQPELDQMLAPVALYPDALLSQVLMAATFPDQVSQAARWSRANPGLQGDDAVRAAQYEGWDPSVQSLVAFPQVLARMHDNPGWTQLLGEAFLVQEPHVMDTVQQLRRRARAAGNLQSSEHTYVQQQGQTIMIQPASPQYVYVPYYDPLVVYGPWWWPVYRPVVWAPWRPHAIRVSPGFFFGNFDWHHRHARVAHPTAYYYHRPRVFENRAAVMTPHRWQHEPQRRATFAARQAMQAVPAPRALQAPPAVQPQPSVQALPQMQRQERRVEWRAAPRIERREERPAARVQAPAVVQAPAAVQAPVRMPAAVAPQQPRAERREQRQERRETRQEQRRERAQKG